MINQISHPHDLFTPESFEEKSKYSKRIEEIMEDAEIEAELEAEQKVRSKHSKLLTMSAVAVVILFGLYFWVDSSSRTSENETLLPEEDVAALSPSASIGEQQLPALQEKLPPKTVPAPAIKNEIPKKASDFLPPPVTPEIRKPIANIPAVRAVTKTPVRRIEKKLPKKSVPIPAPTVSATPVQSGAAAKGFYIQLGAFGNKANAQDFSRKLQAKGFAPSIWAKSQTARVHAVYVGDHPNKTSGQYQFDQLKQAGFSPQWENSPSGSYTFLLGKFKSQREAETLQDRLSIRGFLSGRKFKNSQASLYYVKTGGFSSRTEAVRQQKNLASKGFKSSFIRSEG